MQLSDDADAGAALPVDWDKGLDANLVVPASPNHTRTDGAGGNGPGRESIRNRRLQRRLNKRDQVIEEIRQPEIDNSGLQVGHAVLERAAPGEHARVKFRVDALVAGIRIDTRGRR